MNAKDHFSKSEMAFLRWVFGLAILAILLVVFSQAFAAGTTATVSWTPPTTFTDGTPLTGLIGFRIDAKPKTYQGPTLTKTVGPGITSTQFAGLICGDYDFTAITLAGTNSDPSNTAPYATGITCSNKPNPPQGVTVS